MSKSDLFIFEFSSFEVDKLFRMEPMLMVDDDCPLVTVVVVSVVLALDDVFVVVVSLRVSDSGSDLT